jgi:hypothetical protein
MINMEYILVSTNDKNPLSIWNIFWSGQVTRKQYNRRLAFRRRINEK